MSISDDSFLRFNKVFFVVPFLGNLIGIKLISPYITILFSKHLGFTQHTMEKFTKVLKLGDNLILPLLIVLLDEVPLPIIVELLHQSTILDVPQHLEVRLALHLLVIPHTIEETLRTILDLHKGSRAVFIHLESINTSHNLVEGPLNRTDVAGVESVVFHKFGPVCISRLVLIPSPMVRVKSLAKMILRDDHILR